jgi:hypothetical protein
MDAPLISAEQQKMDRTAFGVSLFTIAPCVVRVFAALSPW